tara:strand:+ start:670 stop:951 length:282 start_codon:yes stop_codon:yes gene_type:complete
MSRNIGTPKGYDEQGNFSPLLAMQALSKRIDELIEENTNLRSEVISLRFAYELSRKMAKDENDKLFTQLCDALEQMSEMAIELKDEMALNHEV